LISRLLILAKETEERLENGEGAVPFFCTRTLVMPGIARVLVQKNGTTAR